MAIFHSKYIRLGIWRVDDEGRFVASIDRRKFVVVLFAHIVYFVDYSTGKIPSWVWQLLSCVTLLLIVTRFFLYWRYKSFPPYEGMDLPSQAAAKQLLEFRHHYFCDRPPCPGLWLWLFEIRMEPHPQKILILPENILSSHRHPRLEEKHRELILSQLDHQDLRTKDSFLCQLDLPAGGRCRTCLYQSFWPGCLSPPCHRADDYLFYLWLYFLSLFAFGKGMWITVGGPSTLHSKLDIMVSNPARFYFRWACWRHLSLLTSVLQLYSWIFLLFNEAFLCINYAVAGLSAGSREECKLVWHVGIWLPACLYIKSIIRSLYISMASSIFLNRSVSWVICFFDFGGLQPCAAFHTFQAAEKIIRRICYRIVPFCSSLFFFPKGKILNKAAMTKYRVAVLTMPVEKVIEQAYREGKTYEPVIRAAQNQWFIINTLIYDKNNPDVSKPGFHPDSSRSTE